MASADKLIIALSSYLLSISNLNTRKHYRSVILQFLRFLKNNQIHYSSVPGYYISMWRQDLSLTGGIAGSGPHDNIENFKPNSDVSIENKTAVISSFYSFLAKPGIDGSQPLVPVNPINSLVNKTSIENYSNSKKISPAAFNQIIKNLNHNSVIGLRNIALLWGYFITGRRSSEWVSLKWGEINWDTSPPTYSFIRKGAKISQDEIPENLKKILLKYLIARWGPNFHSNIPANSYIFSTLGDCSKPLTSRYVLKLIKTLASKAGLDPKQICTHSLRHLHAEMSLKQGASVDQIRNRLKHSRLSTTQKYISSLNSNQDFSQQLFDLL